MGVPGLTRNPAGSFHVIDLKEEIAKTTILEPLNRFASRSHLLALPLAI